MEDFPYYTFQAQMFLVRFALAISVHVLFSVVPVAVIIEMHEKTNTEKFDRVMRLKQPMEYL